MSAHIRIFDTTLRDGEQSPGASLNFKEKLEIARQLQTLGVDVIEAGFPITSDGDYEAVKAIAADLTEPIICGLARCIDQDIERAASALESAKKPRIHVFCATSKIHLEHKFRKSFEAIVDMSVKGVTKARKYVEDVEFSPEDASRTNLDDLETVTRAVIEAGATTINLPDTVGYSFPEEYGHVFSELRRRIPEIDTQGIILSAHCHNDLGLAVANSLAAIRGGARQVECTINGIGERAGNAALEELVMALNVRKDELSQYSISVDPSRIYASSRMVSNLTGLLVQRNKAIVGQNAFAHESGIHQDGMLKNRETYEIMDPRTIGVPESKLVLGKHSGRHALMDRAKELGYALDETMQQTLYERFKTLADKKKDVFDEDVEALIEALYERESSIWELKRFHVTAGSEGMAMALVELEDSSGQIIQDTAHGDGPIDAVFSAVQRITGIQVNLLDYSSRAVSEGKDAQGEASVTLLHNGRRVRGRGFSTDVVESAANAFLSALNRLRMQQDIQAQRGV